nr:immunoglobulin heavy chain junction region [Mus musculus]MBK4198510.1 immunoglobulin heavy chain junction region [Mus musculus]MBK4198512.1 immunoglobulin heavy chain junction region [Mus musculus]MBK4198513.1 immunoglobulin heavy chain junction region [Mus musculus]
CARLGYYFDFW